jgi:hypothetical protein
MFSLLVTLALAEPIATGHVVPANVQMFSEVRLTKATGKVKGKDCAGALAAAMEDLKRVMGKNETTDIITMYTLNARKGWGHVAEVECEYNGPADAPKSTDVKVEALVTKAGGTAAYPQISGQRVIEMMDALVGDRESFVGLMLMTMKVPEVDGTLYFHTKTSDRKDQFVPSDNQNDRGVTMFREIITPELRRLAPYYAPIGEVYGLWITSECERINKNGEEEGETWHFRVPNDVANDFVTGKVSEQQLINAGAVLLGGGNNPVRVDISMVAADD